MRKIHGKLQIPPSRKIIRTPLRLPLLDTKKTEIQSFRHGDCNPCLFLFGSIVINITIGSSRVDPDRDKKGPVESSTTTALGVVDEQHTILVRLSASSSSSSSTTTTTSTTTRDLSGLQQWATANGIVTHQLDLTSYTSNGETPDDGDEEHGCFGVTALSDLPQGTRILTVPSSLILYGFNYLLTRRKDRWSKMRIIIRNEKGQSLLTQRMTSGHTESLSTKRLQEFL